MAFLVLGLAVAALAVLLLARAPRASARAPWAPVLLAYLVPAATVLAVFAIHYGDATRHRFALLGVGFRGAPSEPLEATIGGDRAAHEVWVSALATGGTVGPALGRLTLTPAATEGARGLLEVAAVDAAAGLLGLRTAGGAIVPLGAVALAEGDVLRLGGVAWTVERGAFGGATLVSGEVRVDLPRRRGTLPFVDLALPIFRKPPASAATFPAAHLATEAGGAGAAQAFFFWRDGAPWLADPAGEATVERGGEAVALPDRRELPAGAPLHVLSLPRWDGEGFVAGGVRDRRSFRVEPGRRSLALAYDTPEIVVLPPESLAELAVTTRHEDGDDIAEETAAEGEGDAADGYRPLRLHLAMGGWQITDASLYFNHASGPVGVEALATLELGAPGLAGDGPVAATTPRGRRSGRYGEPLWLGGEHLAAVQVDVLRPPVLLGLLALLLALAKTAAARAARLSPTQLVVVAAAEALLAARLLLAYRAWAMPPFDQEAWELALAAWGVLPWCLLVAALPLRRDDEARRLVGRAVPVLAGGFFAAAWGWALGGGGLRAALWPLLVALSAVPWGVRWLTAGRGRGAVDRLVARLEGEGRRPVVLWTALAFFPAVARAALLVAGYRESLSVAGQRFALTLLHVPVGIVLQALYLLWLWRRVTAVGRLAPRDLVPAAGFVVGTWILPAVLVSDLGLMLLQVPVFLVALVSLAAAARRPLDLELADRRTRTLRWLPLAALAGYLVFAALPLGARALVAVLPADTLLELESERNFLRLLAFAYPERLEEVARRGSEELAVMSAVMDAYTSGPVLGRGYFATETSPHLAATALREHVPAIFVAGEWGLVGILGLLLVYFATGVAGETAAAWRDRDAAVTGVGGEALAGAVAQLAALTLAIPSVYMLLATYRLTLFTGKNAYLLGLDSTADVLEAWLLLVLFAVATAVARDSEEGWG